MKSRTSGITLLEIMLVLVIAVSLLLLSVRVYKQFQFQANEKKIAASVNQVFQALSSYYFANCRMALDADSNPQSTGKLDPLVRDASGITRTFVLSLETALVTPGFLRGWQPNNPLVDNTAANRGYFIQFNRLLSGATDPVMTVFACTGPSSSTSSSACDTVSGAVLQAGEGPTLQSHVVLWTAQVAVKLSTTLTPVQWVQIKNDLNADCISSASGNGVATCASQAGQAGYLVWTRMPSAYNPTVTSDYWAILPSVKQFNMQYTNDGMAALSGVSNETRDPTTGKDWYNSLNYLCGG
ncbi:MAG TPA: type II secretion system protein [Gammaproteobacteria bacterium]|nr:type II secretion system protein [Gammaproteobacteria bacterium]